MRLVLPCDDDIGFGLSYAERQVIIETRVTFAYRYAMRDNVRAAFLLQCKCRLERDHTKRLSRIDDSIDAWHEAVYDPKDPKTNLSLPEWLGMSEDQYALFATNPGLYTRIYEAP